MAIIETDLGWSCPEEYYIYNKGPLFDVHWQGKTTKNYDGAAIACYLIVPNEHNNPNIRNLTRVYLFSTDSKNIDCSGGGFSSGTFSWQGLTFYYREYSNKGNNNPISLGNLHQVSIPSAESLSNRERELIFSSIHVKNQNLHSVLVPVRWKPERGGVNLETSFEILVS